MSLKFQKTVNHEAERMIECVFGKPKVVDLEHKTFLFDGMNKSTPSHYIEGIMRTAGQGMVIKTHSVGDVEELNGVKWRATEHGWVRVND